MKQLAEQLQHPSIFLLHTVQLAKLLVEVHSLLHWKIIHKHLHVCMKDDLVPNCTVSGTSSRVFPFAFQETGWFALTRCSSFCSPPQHQRPGPVLLATRCHLSYGLPDAPRTAVWQATQSGSPTDTDLLACFFQLVGLNYHSLMYWL